MTFGKTQTNTVVAYFKKRFCAAENHGKLNEDSPTQGRDSDTGPTDFRRVLTTNCDFSMKLIIITVEFQLSVTHVNK
jgi:hypothetical protein